MSTIDQEIGDQPRCWLMAAQQSSARAAAPGNGDPLPADGDPLPAHGARVAVIGCGTSLYMAQAYASLRERGGCGETDAFPASEAPDGRRYDAAVYISRSGTTTEVIDLMARFPASTSTVVITAAPGSPAVSQADRAIVLDFADEQSVVQTRFATTCLALLRAHLGEDVSALAAQAEHVLAAPLPVDPAQFRQFVFLGRGFAAALASEAALKMREAGAAWSEAYPAMELRHGPISSLGPHSVVWSLGKSPGGLADQVRATGATWVESLEDPMVALVAAQRLAVATARARGLDPAYPRHLTRSVVLPGSAVS